MTQQTQPSTQNTPLPPLRQEITLLNQKKDHYGRPYWTLFDPITHRFFRIDTHAFQLLSLWRENTSPQILKNAMRIYFKTITTDEKIQQLSQWLDQNFLLKRKNGQWQNLNRYKNKHTKSLVKTILHNYIFLKVPLVKPQKFLRAGWDIVQPLYSKTAGIITILIGIIGIYLTSRQWDIFIATIPQFLSLKGIIITLIAFATLKIAHELAHAWTAHKYHCTIPTMGVIFILLYPVLYTDITDTWKLGKERFIIAAAGLIIEIAIAAIALFLWNIAEPGILRNALFAIATVGILFSIAVNLNPFMRFDGYYILSDSLGIENLQARAFEMGKWKLREILFKLNLKKPEPLTPTQTQILILWAWGCWIYRFFLFLAIALLIYAFFFKLLGTILFVIEILWFIIIPITTELKIWYTLMPRIIRSPRALVIPVLILITLIALIIPWKTHITIEALLEPVNHSLIFAPQAAQITHLYVTQGQIIEKNQPLAQLHMPAINHQLALNEVNLKTAQLQKRRFPSDKEVRHRKHIIENQIIALNTEREALLKQQRQLTIRAPISGTIAELNQTLNQKRWITQKEPIARIISNEKHVRGYLKHQNLNTIDITAKGRFIPRDITHPILNVSVAHIAQAHAGHIDIPYLAAKFNGTINVDQNQDGQLIPTQTLYPITLTIEGNPHYFSPQEIPRIIQGTVHIKGKREAPIKRIARRIIRIFLREAGL